MFLEVFPEVVLLFSLLYSLGEASRTCQANGKWSGSKPECHPVDCGTPPGLDDAYPLIFDTILGSAVEYRCNDGFISLVGTSLFCDADGLWTGDVVPCEPVNCGAPPALENGEIVSEYYMRILSLKNNS